MYEDLDGIQDAEYDAYEFFGSMAECYIVVLALGLFGQQVVVESPAINRDKTGSLEQLPAQIGGAPLDHGREGRLEQVTLVSGRLKADEGLQLVR